jgi:hypothetical protein
VNRLASLGRERLAAGVLVIGAVVFTATGVTRLLRAGGVEVLTLPLALLAADLVIAGALITRWYAIRPVAQGLAIFGALVHVLVLLRSGPWLIRGWSALLAAAHICALVLFFALSAHEQYDDDDENDDSADDDGDPDADPDADPVSVEANERVGVGVGYGPFATLPAPRSHADLLHQVVERPARPRAEAVERPGEPEAELAAPAVAEQPVAESVAEPEPEPVAEPEPEPVAEPEPEPAAEHEPEPAAEHEPESETEPADEPSAEQPARSD